MIDVANLSVKKRGAMGKAEPFSKKKGVPRKLGTPWIGRETLVWPAFADEVKEAGKSQTGSLVQKVDEVD